MKKDTTPHLTNLIGFGLAFFLGLLTMQDLPHTDGLLEGAARCFSWLVVSLLYGPPIFTLILLGETLNSRKPEDGRFILIQVGVLVVYLVLFAIASVSARSMNQNIFSARVGALTGAFAICAIIGIIYWAAKKIFNNDNPS